MSDQTDHIRRLNDMARTQPQIVNATWVITIGIRHLLAGKDDSPDAFAVARERIAALRHAIATFSDWNEDSDPHGEHDFGSLSLFGAQIYFKIDYCHPDQDTLSPVPGNVELCRRILTVMLAEEY